MKSAQHQILEAWFNNSSFYSRELLENESKIFQEGQKKALDIFQKAAVRVPAYKDFLKKHKINPKSVKTIADFKKIPLTTKENYISNYELKKRCWDGDLITSHMISTSSGTTGHPHFWPRDLQTEIEGALMHELILKNVLHIDKKKTLFINGFAMGNWIAGTFTLACVNLIVWKGYPLTIMTPGYSFENILETIENLAEEFEQIILTGHTPFLKEVAEEISKRKLNKNNLILLGTGQSITENWRAYIVNLLNSNNYTNTFFNLYGSADASLMGFETSLSILIRKFLSENMEISKQLFNDERLPSLNNYDPRLLYFEQAEEELVITKYAGCPLIRYNIHDRGGVLSQTQLSEGLGEKWAVYKNSHSVTNWKLPFIYLFGREKFMVKIYGANIYSEHVQFALNHQRIQPSITGRYIIEEGYDEGNNPQITCHIELNRNIPKSEELIKTIEEVFVEEIRKINSEYNFVLENIGDKVKPKIVLYENGHPKYFSKEKVKKTA